MRRTVVTVKCKYNFFFIFSEVHQSMNAMGPVQS